MIPGQLLSLKIYRKAGFPMLLFPVIKAELYKNICRKSTWILVIPVLLSLLITLGFRTDAVTLTITGNSGSLSCMDYLFMNWTVLSSLGLIGLLILLFSSVQFSGEIERGQIKFFLLRSGSRSGVLFGKYLSTVIVSALSTSAVLIFTVLFYYLMIAGSSHGNGEFHAAVSGLTTGHILAYIGLSLISFLLWIAVSFLFGLYFGPFVDFVLTAVFLYGGNYIASQDMPVSRLFPSYWGNQMLLGSEQPDILLPALGSVILTLVLTAAVLLFAAWRFSNTDIK